MSLELIQCSISTLNDLKICFREILFRIRATVVSVISVFPKNVSFFNRIFNFGKKKSHTEMNPVNIVDDSPTHTCFYS